MSPLLAASCISVGGPPLLGGPLLISPLSPAAHDGLSDATMAVKPSAAISAIVEILMRVLRMWLIKARCIIL